MAPDRGSRGPAAIDWPSWQDDLPGNELQRLHALTALTPMPWWRALILKLAFTKTKIWPSGEVAALRRHHFVHFGRWTFLRPPSGTGRRGDRYLLIETNFNGSFSEYLDAIATDLAKYMKRIWGHCYGCPKDMRPTSDFRRWARGHERGAEHYFCPYPDATVKEIVAAQPLWQRLQADRGRGREELAAEFSGVQSASPEEPSPARWARLLGIYPRLRWPDRSGGVSTVTVWAPVAAGRLDSLRQHLAALAGDRSPFEAVPGTHFARLVLVERLRHHGMSDDALEVQPPRLLFGAVGDGTPHEYLERLASGLPIDGRRAWTDHCDGLEGTDPTDRSTLRSYLEQHRVRGGLFYAAYDMSPEAVRERVDERRRVRDRAVKAQRESPALAVPSGAPGQR